MSTPAASIQDAEPRENVGPSGVLSEADDFLARAQALGLRLTRADYERTRAGVTAFLKAERIPAASPGPSESHDDERRPSVDTRCGSPADSEHEPSATARSASGASSSLSRWLRTTSGQLSFFTAVVQPMSGADEGRARVTLDEVGSAEERRRRRARRRRLLEKQMFLESKLSRETSPHESVTTADPHSPARTIRASSVASEPSTPTRTVELVRTSTPLSQQVVPEPNAARESSPSVSPEINVLNRMARMNDTGKLWLAPRESDVELKSEDSAALHDDSGVFCDPEVSDSSSLMGWGPRAFARTTSATDNLNACMKSMSLLDRIMLSKTSPRRMRREAKARARSVPETDDESSATAPASDGGADMSTTSHWADVSTESASSAAPPAQRGGSVRWTQGASTPMRPTVNVAEHCDFVIEDTSPDKPEAATESPTRARETPNASMTPLTKLDPGAQITPMRYSPGYNVGYSHGRSTSITSMFSPNILTPWSHQGRLMSNAGLTNITSSPNLSGEWVASSSMLSSTSAPRGNMMYTSTPLSHPFGEEPYAVGRGPSPSRLLCIESFPGKSPKQRTALSNESPTKPLRGHAASPLTHRTVRGARSAQDSPEAPAGASLDLSNRLAPLYDATPLPAWDKMPFRRTDTVSPADLFHPVGHAPWLATPEMPASDDDESDTPSRTSRADDERGTPVPSQSRARSARRSAPIQRSTSAAAAMTPIHGDDVFAHTAESAEPRPASAMSDVFSEALASTDANQTEWDKPDGSRVVKLVSEELQAAIDSGTLQTEPKPRYFRLPPGHGSSKAKPSSVSYAGLIGQAILSSSDGRLSLAEIYLWISSVYPYYERGDRGWQNSIRHNLSLNKSFVKLERESSIPGKGGWWAIVPGHESRFQNGVYQPNAARAENGGGSAARALKPTHSAPAHVPRSPMREPCKKRQGALHNSPEPHEDSAADTSFKRPKTTRGARAARPEPSVTPMRVEAPQNSSSGAGRAPMPVLTDGPSSPVTSPLQGLAPDAQGGAPRLWRNELPLFPGGNADKTPNKAPRSTTPHLLPPRPAAAPPYVRSMHEMTDYNMPMYLGPEPPRSFPPSFSPSRRPPMRPIPVTQASVPGMASYAHPAYLACTYPPAPETSFMPWGDMGDVPVGYGAPSPSRLGWPHGQ